VKLAAFIVDVYDVGSYAAVLGGFVKHVKVSLFSLLPYGSIGVGPYTWPWPTPNEYYDPKHGMDAYKAWLDQMIMADELGFDMVATTEHHYSPSGMCPSATVLAAVLSQHIKHARIAITGPCLPFHNPVRLAEEYALIDNLCGGRLVAGMLRGAASEYRTYFTPPGESHGRFQEAAELMVRAWTETRPFGWEGDHFHFREVSIWPRPVQQPLPLLIPSLSEEGIVMAARLHAVAALAYLPVPVAAKNAQVYREECTTRGWEPTPEHIMYQTKCFVADTDEQAFAEYEPILDREAAESPRGPGSSLVSSLGFDTPRSRELRDREFHIGMGAGVPMPKRIASGNVICGSPDSVFAQIKWARDQIGAGIMSVNMAGALVPRDKVTRSLQLFASEVLPRVHEL
jgi:alkanesulfonate monooxygenase SsuD/methylene tetrahydromethanopterin reductase-like flavin-dependent oxidoreductase (luciferase family)